MLFLGLPSSGYFTSKTSGAVIHLSEPPPIAASSLGLGLMVDKVVTQVKLRTSTG